MFGHNLRNNVLLYSFKIKTSIYNSNLLEIFLQNSNGKKIQLILHSKLKTSYKIEKQKSPKNIIGVYILYYEHSE